MSNAHARALAEKIKTAFRYGDAAGALTIEAAIKAVDQLAALSAPAAVAGWQLVPVVLTQAMVDAADKTIRSYDDHEGDATRRMWRNMLAAAPKPSPEGQS